MIIVPYTYDWLKTESNMSVVDVTSFYFLALLQNVVETNTCVIICIIFFLLFMVLGFRHYCYATQIYDIISKVMCIGKSFVLFTTESNNKVGIGIGMNAVL